MLHCRDSGPLSKALGLPLPAWRPKRQPDLQASKLCLTFCHGAAAILGRVPQRSASGSW